MIADGDMKAVKQEGVGIDRTKSSEWNPKVGMNKGWELLRGEDSGRECVSWVSRERELVKGRGV